MEYRKGKEVYWNKEKAKRVEKNVIWVILNDGEDFNAVMEACSWTIDGIRYVHNPKSLYYLPVFNPDPNKDVYFMYEEGEE